MHKNDITSIGWLHNADGSYALTICLKGQIDHVYVSISKSEFDAAGGLDGLKANKQIVINFYNEYGSGRVYKGNNLTV